MSKFYTNVALNKRDILVIGYEDGQRFQRRIEYKPYLFETNEVWSQRGTPTKFRTLAGKPVYKREFDDIFEARQYIANFKDVDGKHIFGLNNYVYTYINDEYNGSIDYDPGMISIVSLDIETDSEGGFPNMDTADKAVISLTVRKKGKCVVLGLKPYTPKSEDVTYIHCRDEVDLLNKFLTIWQSKQYAPDILTGWNVEMFDIPYLIKRITRVIGASAAKRMSPWGMIKEREVEMFGRKTIMYELAGINILDYMQLYKKFSFQMQESYKLDHIANIELGENKLDYSEYEGLHDLYVRNFELFIDYNIHDVVLVDKLEDKCKFIEQVLAIAYDGHVNLNDAFTSVRMWDIIIHNYLLNQGIVIPLQEKQEKDGTIVGAYVKDPQVGMHKWVVSFDLNSLYPHLIMQYNISPETYRGTIDGLTVDSILDGALKRPEIADRLIKNNVAIAATGCMFDRDFQGFLPQLMQSMYNDRVTFKQMMIAAKKQYELTPTYDLEKEIARCHNMQLAKKIQLNSAYGALSNIYFRWFAIHLAESITKSGQLSIRWMENHMNTYLNKQLATEGVDYVITCDTDSMYIRLDTLVEQTCQGKTTQEIVAYLDKVCQQVFEPYIDKCYDKLADYVNAYDQKMKMKREAIADKGIYTAKKRYILNVYNLEGVAYAEPKLKIQGIEAVRSSTPAACRANIKKGIALIMNGTEDDMIKFIADSRAEFRTYDFEQVAFPRSVRGLRKYMDSSTIYASATPIHVKGALIYNHLVKTKQLTNKYQLISEGEKIKFCYLMEPNRSHSPVIAAPGALPPEFNITQDIDYDKQFDKSFLEPLKTILDCIGWRTEKRATLEDFF